MYGRWIHQIFKIDYKEKNKSETEHAVNLINSPSGQRPLIIYNFNFSNKDPDLLNEVREIMKQIGTTDPEYITKQSIETGPVYTCSIHNICLQSDNNDSREPILLPIRNTEFNDQPQQNQRGVLFDETNIEEINKLQQDENPSNELHIEQNNE